MAMHQGCLSTLTLADAPYQSWTDLKGQKIGIVGTVGGGMANYAFRLILDEGLNPQTDFEWLSFDYAGANIALENGDVEAIVTADTAVHAAVEGGKYRRITYMANDAYMQDESCCILAFSPDFVEENPVLLTELVKALKEANDYLQNNKEEVIAYALEKGYLDGTLEDNYAIIEPFDFNASAALAKYTIEKSFKDYQEFGLIDKNVDLNKVLDLVFVEIEGVE
jgi:NitT/TauT family transport system substrate-binding protein